MDDRRVRRALLELADTLRPGFDLQDHLRALARYGAELLQVSAAGVLLLDLPGAELAAASDDAAYELQLLQLRHAEGPGLDSYHGARPVFCPDVAGERGGWPRWAPAARAAGYAAVHTLPIRLRDQRLGSMSLFRATTGDLDPALAELGQAMAEVAAIGILQQRTVRRQELVAEQLQNALDSRVLIEQAKGMLAARLGVGIEDAFGVLREHARARNRKLLDVAQEVTDGGLWIAPHG
ncbi:GAF and ANTAR domain-containing protein [Nonomuraea guangzhouensis]|uniref:GAF and ANTAR domain-containing protein n=1 Tax=Nonomuraea guangzhouensis TaxID=1291555 RepID=A0ABW4GMW4_9ACTN|nr:GAF and ANTAR domain-containing protein [Nonomuraea guangzhouensis]